MKKLVVYQSKYGSTKQYALWIAQTLHADIMNVRSVDWKTLRSYDLIIFGSYLHIGKIVDVDFLIYNWLTLQSKKVIIFTTSGTPPTDDKIQEYYENSVPFYIRGKVEYFPLWGRVSQLDITDRLLLLFPQTMLLVKSLVTHNEEDRLAFDAMCQKFDHVEKGSINPIIASTFGKGR